MPKEKVNLTELRNIAGGSNAASKRVAQAHMGEKIDPDNVAQYIGQKVVILWDGFPVEYMIGTLIYVAKCNCGSPGLNVRFNVDGGDHYYDWSGTYDTLIVYKYR